MSMDRCSSCSRLIDTDFDLDCYDVLEDRCICEVCRDRDFFWCEQGQHYADVDDLAHDDADSCIDCLQIAAESIHDAATGDR